MVVEVRFVDACSYDEIYAETDRIVQEIGHRVYTIPCVGFNALSSLDYVGCMREIAETVTRIVKTIKLV